MEKSVIYHIPLNLDWQKYVPKSYLDKIKKQDLWVTISGTKNVFTITQSDINMKINVDKNDWEEIVIYNTALSDKEIKQIYKLSKDFQ